MREIHYLSLNNLIELNTSTCLGTNKDEKGQSNEGRLNSLLKRLLDQAITGGFENKSNDEFLFRKESELV